MASVSLSAPQRVAAPRVQVRFVLAAAGVVTFLLTLLVMAQAWNAYATTYQLFSSIAETSSAKVGASEQALQYVAQMDTRAADFVATAPDNPTHWQDQDEIHRAYQSFRDQMFAVRANLETDEERSAYQRIEYFSFDQFWQHLGNLITAEQNGDTNTAVNEYVIADNYLQNQIARYLLQLEALNFQAMENTQRSAAQVIYTQVALLGVLVVGLAVGLTALSFWLRGKVRRVLTPGLDAAMVLGWLLAILILAELARTPEQLRSMVEDAYYNVSASSRVLAVANQANSAQSGSVIDPTHAATQGGWQENFDVYKTSVELRLCGQPGCLARSFSSANPSAIDTPVVAAANQADLTSIGGIKPLVSNVNYSGEPAALESTRAAYVDYLNINTQLRTLLKANAIDDATRIVTGSGPGQSGEAFSRFTQAVEQERKINRDVFDSIWNAAKSTLPAHQVLFGLVGYIALIVLLFVGVYHRYREL